ncbi:type II toxin-antitoxin system HicA family toxin [Burkholderia diffusa]|uniref:type II toxin-antitoxin system HicA family toxin n=1 Tax=Burkholderia diffusa TaxID=488732 RepID=UPI003132A996
MFKVSPCSKHGGTVKQSEFKRWLAEQGVRFEEGANHTKAYLNGNRATLPRHPSKELKKGTMEGIKKQLSLK